MLKYDGLVPSPRRKGCPSISNDPEVEEAARLVSSLSGPTIRPRRNPQRPLPKLTPLGTKNTEKIQAAVKAQKLKRPGYLDRFEAYQLTQNRLTTPRRVDPEGTASSVEEAGKMMDVADNVENGNGGGPEDGGSHVVAATPRSPSQTVTREARRLDFHDSGIGKKEKECPEASNERAEHRAVEEQVGRQRAPPGLQGSRWADGSDNRKDPSGHSTPPIGTHTHAHGISSSKIGNVMQSAQRQSGSASPPLYPLAPSASHAAVATPAEDTNRRIPGYLPSSFRKGETNEHMHPELRNAKMRHRAQSMDHQSTLWTTTGYPTGLRSSQVAAPAVNLDHANPACSADPHVSNVTYGQASGGVHQSEPGPVSDDTPEIQRTHQSEPGPVSGDLPRIQRTLELMNRQLKDLKLSMNAYGPEMVKNFQRDICKQKKVIEQQRSYIEDLESQLAPFRPRDTHQGDMSTQKNYAQEPHSYSAGPRASIPSAEIRAGAQNQPEDGHDGMDVPVHSEQEGLQNVRQHPRHPPSQYYEGYHAYNSQFQAGRPEAAQRPGDETRNAAGPSFHHRRTWTGLRNEAGHVPHARQSSQNVVYGGYSGTGYASGAADTTRPETQGAGAVHSRFTYPKEQQYQDSRGAREAVDPDNSGIQAAQNRRMCDYPTGPGYGGPSTTQRPTAAFHGTSDPRHEAWAPHQYPAHAYAAQFYQGRSEKPDQIEMRYAPSQDNSREVRVTQVHNQELQSDSRGPFGDGEMKTAMNQEANRTAVGAGDVRVSQSQVPGVAAGIGKKGPRTRKNWSNDENNRFFAVAKQYEGKPDRAMLKALEEELKDTRTYSQVKGHVKNMRASGVLHKANVMQEKTPAPT